MNQVFWFLTFLSLGGFSSQVSSAVADETTHSVKVYTVSSGVTAPELLPMSLSSTLRSNCREEESGDVQLSLVVDETGRPRNVFFVRPVAKSLDRLALQVVLADRFTPGTHDGVAVAVAMLIDLKLEGCVVKEKSDSGEDTFQEHLKAEPVQKLSSYKGVPPYLVLPDGEPLHANDSANRIGKGVTAPLPIATPDAKYPLDKNLRKTGICLITLTVDANGLPQSPRVFRSLSPAMDQQALAAVRLYRFRPAMKADQPVSVNMMIEVNFK